MINILFVAICDFIFLKNVSLEFQTNKNEMGPNHQVLVKSI